MEWQSRHRKGVSSQWHMDIGASPRTGRANCMEDEPTILPKPAAVLDLSYPSKLKNAFIQKMLALFFWETNGKLLKT